MMNSNHKLNSINYEKVFLFVIDSNHISKCGTFLLMSAEKKDIKSTENGKKCVDLGLSVYWGTCNVGASLPEEYGNYYSWGEISVKDDYTKNTYEHETKEETHIDKDGFEVKTYSQYINIGSNIAGTQYDVATKEWGGKWRMPTKKEFEELIDKCNSEVTEKNGVRGIKFTSKENGNWIFLPFAGYKEGGYFGSTSYQETRHQDGYAYWTSNCDGNQHAYCYTATKIGARVTSVFCGRSDGLSIRPVCE